MICIIVIEANFKIENPIKIFFIKKTIDQIRFVYLSKRTCVHLDRLLLKSGPGPWTRIQKNLDPEKPGPRKTWTLNNLDPEKPGPEKHGL